MSRRRPGPSRWCRRARPRGAQRRRASSSSATSRLHAVSEPARRGARARAELEHLVPEIQTGRDGLEHLRLHELGPLRRAAEVRGSRSSRPTLARLVCFRKGVRCQVVSMNGQPAPATIVGTFPMPVGTLLRVARTRRPPDRLVAGRGARRGHRGRRQLCPAAVAGALDPGRHGARDAGIRRRRPALRLPRAASLRDRLDGADARRRQPAARGAHPPPRRPPARRGRAQPRRGDALRPARCPLRIATIDVRPPDGPAGAGMLPTRSSPIPPTRGRCGNGVAPSARAAARSRAPSSATPGSRSGAGARSSACKPRCHTSPSRCR